MTWIWKGLYPAFTAHVRHQSWVWYFIFAPCLLVYECVLFCVWSQYINPTTHCHCYLVMMNAHWELCFHGSRFNLSKAGLSRKFWFVTTLTEILCVWVFHLSLCIRFISKTVFIFLNICLRGLFIQITKQKHIFRRWRSLFASFCHVFNPCRSCSLSFALLLRHHSPALPDCLHAAGCRDYARHIRLSAFNR